MGNVKYLRPVISFPLSNILLEYDMSKFLTSAVWSFEEDNPATLLIWGTHEFPKKKEVVCLLSRDPLEGAVLPEQDTSKSPISLVLMSEGGSLAVFNLGKPLISKEDRHGMMKLFSFLVILYSHSSISSIYQISHSSNSSIYQIVSAFNFGKATADEDEDEQEDGPS